MARSMTLVSHHLCPYVQRVAILAAEKSIRLERVLIDLGRKPAWFTAVSPAGKVPLLLVDDVAIFESAVISEFLDEISSGSLHPADPLERAQERAWIEFASGTLSEIAGFYSAVDEAEFERRRAVLARRFDQVAAASLAKPWFGGGEFRMVDAAWAPVFRYLEVIEPVLAIDLASRDAGLRSWMRALAERPSVISAVAEDYPSRLLAFLAQKDSHLSRLMRGSAGINPVFSP